jgi:hypothetical protein
VVQISERDGKVVDACGHLVGAVRGLLGLARTMEEPSQRSIVCQEARRVLGALDKLREALPKL